jgi:exodeoxyribonuclease V alpha subunit
MTTLVELRGDVMRWAMHGGKGWGVGLVRAADHGDVTVCGIVPGARIGDHVLASGAFEDHPTFGRQFHIVKAQLTPPTSVDGVAAWIVDKFPNVGMSRAKRMVEHFGGVDELWRVVELDPERLAEIKGITRARAAQIRTAYLAAREDREHEITLRGWGLTPNAIARCLEVWLTAGEAVRVIRQDPYMLFRRVHGFGWARADIIAMRSKVPADDPHRIETAIEHVLATNLEEGHVWMRPGTMQLACESLLRLERPVVLAGIRRALASRHIVKRGGRVYLAATERSESELAEQICRRLTRWQPDRTLSN